MNAVDDTTSHKQQHCSNTRQQQAITSPFCMVNSPFWDSVEPHWEEDGAPPFPCYSKTLKAYLIPGTFVLLSTRNDTQHGCVIARIVDMIIDTSSCMPLRNVSVKVNIFQRLTEFVAGTTVGFMHPEALDDNHLRYLPEIVQTAELRVISSDDIMNLAFVFFTRTVLKDSTNLFSTCQGMTNAFILRFRTQQPEVESSLLTNVPDGYCLPFPSSYTSNARFYHDCFPCRIWNSVVSVKLEITKLLGRYLHLQGLYCKEHCRLSNFTAEAWGCLRLQFDDIFDDAACGMSTRIRRHRVNESGLVVKAVQVSSSCTILRFETKTHLQHLCNVFGELATVGQRCRLPKISVPKPLWRNDIINVVYGSDIQEPVFNAKTVCDGIDLEFDGRSELFITVRYRRFSYTGANSLVVSECDPLLSALICRRDPYDDLRAHEPAEEDHVIIAHGSEFQDYDGCLYEVLISVGTTHVRCRCIYPQRDNPLHGLEKLFNLPTAHELIERRLRG